MNNTPFIGTGKNPDGPDLPLGLGMQLAQNPKAMATFGKMSTAQKSRLIGHIQDASTGEDAKSRIERTVNALAQNQTF